MRLYPLLLSTLLILGFSVAVDIACNDDICMLEVTPGEEISARLEVPFRIASSDPVFSPTFCNPAKEVCTKFDRRVVVLSGTLSKLEIAFIEFDCFPKNCSFLKVVRIGESVPKAEKKHSALSPHFVVTDNYGRLEGSQQIVVSCYFFGSVFPHLKSGKKDISKVLKIPSSGLCPPNYLCYKVVQRVTFYGRMGNGTIEYKLKGTFPSEELNVSLVPKR